MRYIALPGTWFKEGTEAKLIDDYRPVIECGLFSGIRVSENPDSEGGLRGEYEDEEICGFDEFEVHQDDAAVGGIIPHALH